MLNNLVKRILIAFCLPGTESFLVDCPAARDLVALMKSSSEHEDCVPILVSFTFAVTRNRPVLTLAGIPELIMDEAAGTAGRFDGFLFGYAVLPSRIHLLLGLSDSSLEEDFVNVFRSRSARQIQKAELGPIGGSLYAGGKFQLWQKDYDRVSVNSEADCRERLEFIHRRPVKAGLVKQPADYTYSSAAFWEGQGDSHLHLERDFSRFLTGD